MKENIVCWQAIEVGVEPARAKQMYHLVLEFPQILIIFSKRVKEYAIILSKLWEDILPSAMYNMYIGLVLPPILPHLQQAESWNTKKQQAAQAVNMSFITAVTYLHLGMPSKWHKFAYVSPMLTACGSFWMQAYREQFVFAWLMSCHS